MFRGWAESLPGDIEVCALQLPGREGRMGEPPLRRLDAIVEGVTEAVEPLLTTPVAFFGHSLGALIAFEVSRRLRRKRSAPTHLFVSAARAPHRPDPDPPVSHLPDAEFIHEVRRRYDGIPPEVLAHPELLDLLTPTLRADFAVFESYLHVEDTPLDCPISCIGGLDDPHVTLEDLEAWRCHTRGTFGQTVLPGGHFYLAGCREQVLDVVSKGLSRPAGREA